MVLKDLRLMSSKYISIDSLLIKRDHASINGRSIDCIDIEYEGVVVHVYGVLHGLTGGLNKAYVGKVNEAISSSLGIKFYERNFGDVYAGLDVDTQDWAAIPLLDAFFLVLKANLTPLRMIRLFLIQIGERLRREDDFLSHGFPRLQNIGGSMAFHAIEPSLRRALAGFPPPREYLIENLRRRKGRGKLPPPMLMDTRWGWMGQSEPHANIPLRSIHMLEFAVEYSKLAGQSVASIFVGEIHNTDMEWYASLDGVGEIQSEDARLVQGVVNKAKLMARDSFGGRGVCFARWAFYAVATIGAVLPMSGYLCGLLLLARFLRVL